MTRHYQETKVIEAVLPLDLALGMGAFITLGDSFQHVYAGLGLVSSLVGTSDSIIAMVGPVSYFQIFWGILMGLVSITLFTMAGRTRDRK